jgi:7,8-dihydro-6-hydroxymethylpterin dimethyltransferase
VRRRALANLESAGLSTTLVVVVKKGVNDLEVGEIVAHALDYECVRGVTFQPIQDAGRNLGFDKNRDRAMLTDIRRVIGERSGVFSTADLLPLPCNPEAIAIGYGLRDGRQVTPITRLIPEAELLANAGNTISFEKDPELKQRLIELLSLACAGEQTDPALRGLLCCLPQFEVPAGLGYNKVFRVVIVQFLDRFNFCLAQVKRSCIHFVTAERKIIPFDTYNLFYRNGAPALRPASLHV